MASDDAIDDDEVCSDKLMRADGYIHVLGITTSYTLFTYEYKKKQNETLAIRVIPLFVVEDTHTCYVIVPHDLEDDFGVAEEIGGAKRVRTGAAVVDHRLACLAE